MEENNRAVVTSDEMEKVIKAAKITAFCHCRRFHVFPARFDEVEQTAIIYALEMLDKIPRPIEENLNRVGRVVGLRLIDAYRHETNAAKRFVNETNLENAGYDPWTGAAERNYSERERDYFKSEEFKTAIWETFNKALEPYGERDQDIIRRRIIEREKGAAVAAVHSVKSQTVHRIVWRFKRTFRRIWKERENNGDVCN